MYILDFLALILATDAIVTAWFHGSIFERPRTYFKTSSGLLAELMSCPLCFSYHAAFWLMLLIAGPASLLPAPWSDLLKLVLYSLATTDVVHFLQQIRPITDEEEEEEDEETTDSSEDTGGDTEE